MSGLQNEEIDLTKQQMFYLTETFDFIPRRVPLRSMSYRDKIISVNIEVQLVSATAMPHDQGTRSPTGCELSSASVRELLIAFPARTKYHICVVAGVSTTKSC